MKKLWGILLACLMICAGAGACADTERTQLNINGLKFRPGDTAFSTLKGRQDPRYTAEDVADILTYYCPDLLALDLGHNNVHDVEFLRAWPKLRRLIIVDSKEPLTDISALADLKDLEYVELFMQGITDISPLADHVYLKDLNLAHNDITDLTPLYSCTSLERLWIAYNPHLTDEELAAFKEAMPNVKVESEEYQSTGMGWRVHPHYDILVESFKTGTYIPFEDSQPLEGEESTEEIAQPEETAEAAEDDGTAKDISLDCQFNGIQATTSHILTNNEYARIFETSMKDGASSLIITAPENIGAIYIQWCLWPHALNIQTKQGDEWVTVATSDGDFYADYIEVPEASEIRLVDRDDPTDKLRIREMKVFTPGTPPDTVQLWEKPGDKVDMLMICGHPDDELLWFGGMIPYYAGQEGKDVLVVCCAMTDSMRQLELLDVLWHCGVRVHPLFMHWMDYSTTDPRDVLKTWGKDKCLETITGIYRQYKPDVVMLQDVNGEYGHGIHKAGCQLGQECLELAANAEIYPEQVVEYGTWDVPKTYIHLYAENQIRMDWDQPLSAFGGKTAMEVAMEAMEYHKSQTQRGWKITVGGEKDNTLFGLYRSLVGEDVEKNDVFENIQ